MVATLTVIMTPSSTDLNPFLVPRSVRTQPGQIDVTLIPFARNAFA